jgi:Raf kinase inhibitor-like YbhB/YbcL family protein
MSRRSQAHAYAASLWLVAAAASCSTSSPSHNDGSGNAGTSASAGTSGSQAGSSGSGAAGTGAAGTGTAGSGAAGTGAGGAAGGATGAAGTGGATGAAGTTGAAGSKNDGGTDAVVDKPAGEGGAKTDGGSLTLTTTSLKMADGGLVFPPASSAPMNMSPALAWTGVPAGTLSFALSMYDATAKNTHWILWNIAPTETGLPANLPRGAMPTIPVGSTQMSAFGGMPGYEGPGGGGINNYEIELWALKVATLPVGNMTLNVIHSTLLPAQKIESAQILAKGTRNGL